MLFWDWKKIAEMTLLLHMLWHMIRRDLKLQVPRKKNSRRGAINSCGGNSNSTPHRTVWSLAISVMRDAYCRLHSEAAAWSKAIGEAPFMNMVWFVQYDSADSWDLWQCWFLGLFYKEEEKKGLKNGYSKMESNKTKAKKRDN